MLEPWFVELVQVVSDIVVAFSAIIVGIVAVIGLNQWSRELKGKARFDAAKKITYQVYKFRDLYKHARGLWTAASESADRDASPIEKKNERQQRDEYFARMNRIKPLQDVLRDLYQSLWETEVVFDNSLAEFIIPFENAFKDLYLAINTYFSRYIERAMHGASVSAADERWLEEYRMKIYGHDEDDLSKEIDAATQNAVQKIKSYL